MIKMCWNTISRFWKQEDAPTMAEYGLLLVVIALIVVAGATILGTGLNNLFSEAGTYVDSVPVPTTGS